MWKAEIDNIPYTQNITHLHCLLLLFLVIFFCPPFCLLLLLLILLFIIICHLFDFILNDLFLMSKIICLVNFAIYRNAAFFFVISLKFLLLCSDLAADCCCYCYVSKRERERCDDTTNCRLGVSMCHSISPVCRY